MAPLRDPGPSTTSVWSSTDMLTATWTRSAIAFHDGTTYNGYARSSVTEAGCGQLAVTAARDGIFARGILMDIPRLKNVSYLASGTPIYIEDLEAWERQAQVTVGEGDVLLIRTGRWALRDENGPWAVAEQEAGLHASTIKWLKERGVAMLGSDSAARRVPIRCRRRDPSGPRPGTRWHWACRSSTTSISKTSRRKQHGRTVGSFC